MRYYARLVSRGVSEPDVVELEHLIQSGVTVIDVGANIGVYTKRLSELVGLRGRVISIEPVPDTFEILQATIRLLRLANIDTYRCAISDTEGHVRMRIPSFAGGGENFYEAEVVETSEESCLTVPAVPLDVLVPGPVAFIKCDVEGHELAVVRGALGLVRRDHPAWLIELSTDPDQTESAAATLCRLLAGEGYGLYLSERGSLRPRVVGDYRVNYFFLRDEHWTQYQRQHSIRRTAATTDLHG